MPTSSLDETTTDAKLAHYRASLKMLRRVAGNRPVTGLCDRRLSSASRRAARSHFLTDRLARRHVGDL